MMPPLLGSSWTGCRRSDGSHCGRCSLVRIAPLSTEYTSGPGWPEPPLGFILPPWSSLHGCFRTTTRWGGGSAVEIPPPSSAPEPAVDVPTLVISAMSPSAAIFLDTAPLGYTAVGQPTHLAAR